GHVPEDATAVPERRIERPVGAVPSERERRASVHVRGARDHDPGIGDDNVPCLLEAPAERGEYAAARAERLVELPVRPVSQHEEALAALRLREPRDDDLSVRLLR